MNEAPKKIWMAADDAFQEYYHQFDGDIGYIRADIVDELVEALEYCKQRIEEIHKPSDWHLRGWAIDNANRVLARLEESHD